MCNACGFLCYALDAFDGCGCKNCFACGDRDCDGECCDEFDDDPAPEDEDFWDAYPPPPDTISEHVPAPGPTPAELEAAGQGRLPL